MRIKKNKPDLRVIKTCSCGNVFNKIKAQDYTENEDGIWFDCKKCQSTCFIPTKKLLKCETTFQKLIRQGYSEDTAAAAIKDALKDKE